MSDDRGYVETPEYDRTARMNSLAARADQSLPSVAVSKKSVLECRHDELFAALNYLSNNVAGLSSELAPVLGPSDPVPGEDETADGREQSTLAHNLQTLTSMTMDINQVVDDLRSRLEV